MRSAADGPFEGENNRHTTRPRRLSGRERGIFSCPDADRLKSSPAALGNATRRSESCKFGIAEIGRFAFVVHHVLVDRRFNSRYGLDT